MKKIVLLLLLTVITIFCAAPSFAQFEMDSKTAAVLAKEPALTQADIDAFFKCFDDIDKATSESDIDRALAKAGISAERMAYIYLKIGLVWIDTKEQPGFIEKYKQQHPQMVPTTAELALIKQNMELSLIHI